MQKIINFFRGSVLYTVTGAFPERFLNLCAQNAVPFWGLEWLDDHTLRLCFARKDAKKARTLAEKVMCEAKAARRVGVPFFLAKFRRRYAFLAGLALAVAAVCAGAVMGDHCSPISDTSIMSSTGAGCDHMAHVNTQLWYGLAVAADCTVCYLLAPALGNPWVPLAIGAALVTGQVFLLNRVSRRRAGEAV